MTIEEFNETCIKLCLADPSLNTELDQTMRKYGYNMRMGVPTKLLADTAIKILSYNYKPEILQSPLILTTECDDFLQKLLSMKHTVDPNKPETYPNKYQHPVNYDNKENTNMEKFIKVNAKKIEDATNTWIDGYIVRKNCESFKPGDIYCYANTADTIPVSYLQYVSADMTPMSTGLLVYGSAEGLISKMPSDYLNDFSNLTIYKVSAYVNRSKAALIQSADRITYDTNDFVVEEVISGDHDINEFINENNDLLHVFKYFTFGTDELTPDVEQIVSKISVDINGINSFVTDILLMKPRIRKLMSRANRIAHTHYNTSHDVLNCLIDVENLIDRSISIINLMADNGCSPSEIVATFMNYKL